MKKLMSMIMVLLLTGVFAFAQQSGKERKAAAEKKAAAERQRSVGGVRTENELKDDKVDLPANQKASGARQDAGQTKEGASEVVPSNRDQQDGASAGDGPDDGTAGSQANSAGNPGNSSPEQKSNAPAIIQRTTSESGSPSVLSDNNGSGRDGTNNVQRSTINMAGAEVPGDMGLSRKSGGQRNMNTGAATRIRKQEEQPQRAISKQEQTRNKQQVEAQQGNGDEARAKRGDDGQKKRARKNRKNKDS